MNQKGFVNIVMILFLPLFLTLSFSGLWFLWFMNQKNQLNNICFEYVLKSQKHLVENNNRLIFLNNRATILYFQKKFLEAIILTAPPPAKIAAQIRKRLVIAQQKILNVQQNLLIKYGNIRSRTSLFRLRRSIHKKNRDIAKFWKVQTWRPASVRISWSPTQVKIRLKDIASIYKRTSDHSQKQSMVVKWRIPLNSLLPKWLTGFVPVHRQWLGQCSSHPHPGGYQWIPAIGEGNHLSKSFY